MGAASTTMEGESLLPDDAGRLGFQAVEGAGFIIPPLREIPAGPVVLGSDPAADPETSRNEEPRHRVQLGSFRIGTYPVTVAEYACAVRSNAVSAPRSWGGLSWQAQSEHPVRPVVCVSWKDAVRYAHWLTRLSGRPWRLPTEAEWEKAARGPDGRRYPWGNRWDRRRANAGDTGNRSTTAVGAYAGLGDSPFGVSDMSGNVWEWCSSIFRPYPYDGHDGREDPDLDAPRVLRGGSWSFSPRVARAAFRYPDLPGSYSYHLVGFRLVQGEATFRP